MIFNHVLDTQILEQYPVKSVDKSPAQLMVKIKSLVTYLPMDFDNFEFLFKAVR